MRADQPARFTSFVDGLAPAERPTLHFLHLLLPHNPHVRLPNGATYDGAAMRVFDPRPEPRVLTDDKNVGYVRWQRLLLQTAYTDALLGRLLDRMESSGLLDSALLVVTADHGEGIAPKAHWRRLDDRNAADLAWVPLFVKTPNQRAGAVDRRNEEHVDLLPSVADLLDLDLPWPVDGRTLYGPPRDPATKTFYDDPGHPRTIETAAAQAKAATGIAPRTGRPDRGLHGLYVVPAIERLYGLRTDTMTTGPPVALTARYSPRPDIDHVHLTSGDLPAMLRGFLSGPVPGASRWLAVAVNGTIAGAVTAAQVPGESRWRFLGMVDHRFYVEGKNDVRFYLVEDDAVLRPLGGLT